MPRTRVSRDPSHAGSWYAGDGGELAAQIDKWLAAVSPEGTAPRAIIAPHAGYSYCGHVMAHAYRHIDPAPVRRIFLLGPSHHVYSRRCLLSGAAEFGTPLGPLPVDRDLLEQLRGSDEFEDLPLPQDEAEHSLELHTPFIKRVMGDRPFLLVPIMVGALSTQGEARMGALLAPYLDDPGNLFIVSSDFCHWGQRFSYTWHQASHGPIWKSVEWLDDLAMRTIEKGEPGAFTAYLQQYRNTICGRHPIAVLLNMLPHCSTRFTVAFNFYDQSSKCQRMTDSSVSYATALVTPAKAGAVAAGAGSADGGAPG